MQRRETDGDRRTETDRESLTRNLTRRTELSSLLRRSYRKATEFTLICAIKFKPFTLASSLFPENVSYKLKNASASSKLSIFLFKYGKNIFIICSKYIMCYFNSLPQFFLRFEKERGDVRPAKDPRA